MRTGSSKSPASRRVAQELRRLGWKLVVVRHPMPYGNLAAQRVQRFATLDDLTRLLRLNKPSLRVSYEIEERTQPDLSRVLSDFTAAHRRQAAVPSS